MNRKIVPQIMLMLLIITLISLAFNIGTVLAQQTIYIRSDGSVDPSTAPISRSGNVYTFTCGYTVTVPGPFEIPPITHECTTTIEDPIVVLGLED